MRFMFFFLFAACMQVSATGYSQQVSLSVRNASLEKVFTIIEKQTGYSFFYNVDMVKNTRDVSLKIEKEPLEKALKSILEGQSLTFNIVEKNIIIRKQQFFPGVEITAPVALLTVSGRVLDAEDNTPLSNATIMIKGSLKGTISNREGTFVLNEIPENATIVISYSGYENKEIKVTRSQTITVLLEKKLSAIHDVVINGLYSRSKDNFTGAMTTITGDDLRSVNNLNVLQALKVFDASVHIPDNIQFGSDPNKLPDITLRGVNNFPGEKANQNETIPVSGADFSANYMSNPNQPLFILDGFEVSIQKIYDLNMSRIASFTILKDASATSIYGSRAANGVIVVETIQPKSGQLKLNYSGQLQITAPDFTVYDLTNAAEKLEVERLAGTYSMYENGIRPDVDAFYKKLYASRLSKVKEGVNTYWLSQPVKVGYGQRHALNLEGGDRFVRYGMNFGYNNTVGVMKNSGRDNYSGSMNFSYRQNKMMVKNVLNVEMNKAKNSNYGSFGDYTKMNSYWNPFDENGKLVQVLEEVKYPLGSTVIYLNPLYNSTLNTIDQSAYTNIINQTHVEYRFSSNVKLAGKIALTKQVDQGDKFLPAKHNAFVNEKDFTQKGSYTQSHGSFFAYDGSMQLDINKVIGNGVFFNTTGVGIAETNSAFSSVTVKGFPNERMDDIGFGNGYPANSKPTGGNSVTRRISGFTNFNYAYDRRYLVDMSLSVDGSSQFGVNKRFAPFWSTGLGWNLHNESFFKSSKTLSLFKLRASIGSTGDNRFPPFMGITSYKYYTDQNYRAAVGATLMGYGNENLQWQQTLKKNIGTDLTMFNNYFNLTLNVYQEITKGLILDINTPPSLGINSYKENVGELENRGYEFSTTLFAIRDQKRQIYWSFFANGNHNKNQIKKISNSLKNLNEKNNQNDKGQQTKPLFRFEEGQSVNAIWAVRSNGIDPSSGREVFIKKDGTLTYQWEAADKVIVGENTPKLSGNFGTNASWNGLTVGLYFSYSYGGQQYNQTLQNRVEGADLNYQVDRRVLLGRWTQPGDVKFFQRMIPTSNGIVALPTYATSRFVQNNDFVNVSSISVSYQIADKATKKLGLTNTRFGFIAGDIYRWSTIQVERGLDYPFARNFTFSINTSFN